MSIISDGLKLDIHLTAAPLKFGNGKVFSSRSLLGMWLHIHDGIKVHSR